MVDFIFPPDKGLVSIILPTHNRQALIIETLNSIVNQDYKHIEIVVVNDHSTDNTVDIVKRYIDSGHHNIVLIESDGHGSNHARNMGMKNSRGEFIAFFDDDDIMCHDFISSRIDLFKKTGTDFVGCDFVHFEGDIDNVILERRLSSIPHNISSHLFYMNLPTHCFLMTRKCVDRLGLWNERVKRLQDMAYFHRLFLYHQKGAYVPLNLFKYRIHGNTITKSHQEDARLFAFREIGKEWKQEGRYDEVKDVIMYMQYVFLRDLWKGNKKLFWTQAFCYLPSLVIMFVKCKLLNKSVKEILKNQI